MAFLGKVRTLARFPPASLARVALYRLGIRAGIHPVFRIRPAAPAWGEFFDSKERTRVGEEPTDVWRDAPWAFGRLVGSASTMPPDWHANILTGGRVAGTHRRWDRIPAFSEAHGDIKAVWEASRFDWVLSFAQAARAGKAAAVPRLNAWLKDWSERNPPYTGPNWMCGQEASIRVAHLALAARILGDVRSIAPALHSMVLTHLRRIAPTTAYARGQDNNHGTSEAMGLILGGLWLAAVSPDAGVRRECSGYAAIGRRLAEDRVQKLVFSDGGFAQYSLVYHRLMLDSLSLMELWRRDWEAEPFSDDFITAARAATDWLEAFVEPTCGDVPNLGSNDGAWLLPLGRSKARDFRPSVALASTLFGSKTLFADAPSAQSMLAWLDLSPETRHSDKPITPPTRLFPDSGIGMLNSGSLRVFLRFPNYRFRPHQADALHLDLWVGSENLLCDAGTFSYACPGWSYYPSTAAHNTVEFDGRDQMPRWGRFLYGEWSHADTITKTDTSLKAAYTDYRGARHERTVKFDGSVITVTDRLSGLFEKASLRWHLTGEAQKDDCFTVAGDHLRLEMTIDGPGQAELEVGRGSRSIYYLAQGATTAVRLHISGPCTVTTRIILH